MVRLALAVILILFIYLVVKRILSEQEETKVARELEEVKSETEKLRLEEEIISVKKQNRALREKLANHETNSINDE